MSSERPNLEDEYVTALRAHLDGAGEIALAHAYEVGRRALMDGTPLLDVLDVHHRALNQLGKEAGLKETRWLEQASELLAECLSPFEMTLAGYREANDKLRKANASLEASNKELARAKADLEQSNQELESFSYSVAHDLRAPLRSLDGFSLAVIEDYGQKLEAEARKYLRYIRQAAQEMGRRIDDLLMLSTVTRREIELSRVDVSALARRTIERFRTLYPDRRVEVSIEDGLFAVADLGLMTIALENLLGNAWKFTSKTPSARIEVGRRSDRGEEVYFVRDNGAGFDPAHAAKMFGVFQRLHSNAEFEGTGIGLATVQRIVRRHGGRIWGEGEKDRGATFYFTLGPGKVDR